jgi:hypothetical protein
MSMPTLNWRRHHAGHQSSRPAGRRVTRAWPSRTKGLVLSGALTLGALAGLTVATPAYAGSPQIYAAGGPGDVSVAGSGFTPGATVRLEALTPGLSVLRTIYVTADGGGDIGGGGVYITSLSPGDVWVAADGAPGPTAWAQTSVSPFPTLQANSMGCPYPGGVSVSGDYVPPGVTTVRVELIAANSSWQLGSVVDTETAPVRNGSFGTDLNLKAPAYSGHAFVAADEDIPGVPTIWTSLGSVC